MMINRNDSGSSRQRLSLSRLLINAGKRSGIGMVSAVLRAVALGLMRPADLAAFVDQTYSNNSAFYDPLVRMERFEERILDALKEHAPGRRLLDAFCGQGREAAIFADAGFDILGIDNLESMVEGARAFAASRPFKADFMVADFASFEDEGGFDIVYTSAWMYTTSPDQLSRRAFLTRCGNLCRDHGVVVISCKRAMNPHAPTVRLLDIVTRLVALVSFGNRAFETGGRLSEGGLFWYHFTNEKLQTEIENAGFRIVHRDESPDGQLDFYLLKRADQVA
ncbi:MAG: methyltransferase domain-containing protein [Verrucomicrobiales bacterium]